jgi:hypothetical protein
MNNKPRLHVIFVLLPIAISPWTVTPISASDLLSPPNLELEWRIQFEDLKLQMANWQKWQGMILPAPHDLTAQTYRQEALVLPSDRDPIDVLVRRTAAVFGAVKRLGPKLDLSATEKTLAELQLRVHAVAITDKNARFALFAELCTVRRQIVLANPLLDFSDIVFCTRGSAPGHCCDQYFGWGNEPGGRLCLLKNAFGPKPELRDLLAEATVSNGRLIGPKLNGGSLLSPALDFEAKTLLFAYAGTSTFASQGERDRWSPERSYHIFKMHLDGTGLTQLTDGPWNDFDPCFLPNRRIAFISERRGGYGRCHPRPVPTYTLHSMNADGSNIVRLSHHETNEWNPSVNHDGMLIYTRWDYVDRWATIAHHPWITSPDGRDARSLHGNYPENPRWRPNMESHVRAIPGSALYLATATPHHDESEGSLVLLDFRVVDDNAMSQVKRITPEIGFPEADRGTAVSSKFSTAWPFSEDFYLACYAPGRIPSSTFEEFPRKVPMGIYLVDSFGNRELIWRDAKLRCWNPIPVRQQSVPPLVPDQFVVKGTDQNQKKCDDQTTGESIVSVLGVYDSLKPWPKDRKVKTLRVVQLFPKSTPYADVPRVGYSAQMLARGVLGTVPVEEDGSAHFVMPAGKAVYFQVLDEQGIAIQSMMSAAYTHAGERLMCQGCHEPRHHAPPSPRTYPLALRRAPSRLAIDVEGTWPLSFARLIQPILDTKCVACHQQERNKNSATKAIDLSIAVVEGNYSHWRGNSGPLFWTQGYANLGKFGWRAGGKSSTPGNVGTFKSRLFPILTKGHHDVKLTPEEWHRFSVWLDCGSPFFGAYEQLAEQAQGKLIRPLIE